METKKDKKALETVAEEVKTEMKEVAFEDLKKITGAGEWDDVPPVDEHPYDPDTIKKA
jgi:hypothetical protein